MNIKSNETYKVKIIFYSLNLKVQFLYKKK